MLEVMTIMSIVYACLFMPLRGKTFEQLSEGQKQRVSKQFARYQKSRKGRQTPDMTIEQFLPIVQKQGLVYLILAICLVPIYILIVVFVYPNLLAGM